MSVQAGTRLGPYEVVAPLGAGGMGEVYRARDERLGRDVAIKVLPDARSASSDVLRRFEQEARAASALSHPNILVVYDVGLHETTPYIVTELLEGETLRRRLRDGALPQKKAVEIAIQIAMGLAAAHEKGIVHRDLKPENVFMTAAGHIKILDFGLAKLIRPEPTGAPSSQADTMPKGTAEGIVLGTAGYMAPEQVQGHECDHRADIFALGCVLYEMLSGRRAFSAETPMEAIAAILSRDPPSLASVGTHVSPALQEIIDRCLEKKAANRFDSSHDLGIALHAFSGSDGARLPSSGTPSRARRRRVWIGVVCVVAIALAVGGVGLWRSRKAAPALAETSPRRIAVLPFENLGAAEDGYFAEGIADEVRGKLLAVPGIAVIARGSAVQYRDSRKSPREISRELGAPYLLTATVRWRKGEGGRSEIRVLPELVVVGANGEATTRWQGSYDADLRDAFRVQTDIATRVAESLEVALSDEAQKRLAQRPTANFAAYDAYLRAESLSNSNAPRIQAIELYERAVALDPNFAMAWAALATARSFYYHLDVPSTALAEKAYLAATRALQLAPGLPEARLAMATYYTRVVKDPLRAHREIVLGLAKSPGHPSLLALLGFVEQSLGRWDDAGAHLEQARSLDPRTLVTAQFFCRNLRWRRLYSRALAAYDGALAIHPDDLLLLNEKSQIYLAQGDLARAQALFEEAAGRGDPKRVLAVMAYRWDLYWALDENQQRTLLSTTPADFDDNRGYWALVLSWTHALRGDGARARKFADDACREFVRVLAESPDDAERRAMLGLAQAYAGRPDEAIREARRALELVPISRDAFFGAYYQHQLVRVYLLAGEKEKALDLLEPLVSIPYSLSPGWLSIDPTFAPLKGNPRFEKLLASGSAPRK